MARVGAGVDRDAVAQALYECLRIVVPFCRDFRGFYGGNQYGAQVVFVQEGLLCVGELLARHGLVAAVQHQAGDRRDALFAVRDHGLGQVLCAGLGVEAPVFIDIDFAVAVQVLKGVAVFFDDDVGVHDAERCAALVLDLPPSAVFFRHLGHGVAAAQDVALFNVYIVLQVVELVAIVADLNAVYAAHVVGLQDDVQDVDDALLHVALGDGAAVVSVQDGIGLGGSAGHNQVVACMHGEVRLGLPAAPVGHNQALEAPLAACDIGA